MAALAYQISFDAERTARYAENVFEGYLDDPADSDFRRGHLAAMLNLYRETRAKGLGEDRLSLLEAQISA